MNDINHSPNLGTHGPSKQVRQCCRQLNGKGLLSAIEIDMLNALREARQIIHEDVTHASQMLRFDALNRINRAIANAEKYEDSNAA